MAQPLNKVFIGQNLVCKAISGSATIIYCAIEKKIKNIFSM